MIKLSISIKAEFLLIGALFALFAVVPVTPETFIDRVNSQEHEFQLLEVVEGLSSPWAMAFLPNGEILVTERSGGLVRIAGGRKTVVRGLPKVAAKGQGGLLDIALHPSFEINRLVYVSYSAAYESGYGTRIGRGKLAGNRIEDFVVLFSMANPTRETHHFGSRLAFAPDGSLFFTIGERGSRDRAQDLSDHAGKILRILDDGSIPDNNPRFNRAGALPEIYSYGHRNPQGLVIDAVSNIVWAHEHGPRGGDEVNIIRPGANYGWPVITYGREYSGGYIAPGEKPGLEQPVIYWTPSIAPSGLTLYDGNAFPGWKGNLFAGALAGNHLRRMVVDGDKIVAQEMLLEGRIGRIRDVRQGPSGNLWLLTDSKSGKLIRIEPIPGG